MLDSAAKLKKQEESKKREEEIKLVEKLPVLTIPEEEDYQTYVPLDPDKPFSKSAIRDLMNVNKGRRVKGSPEAMERIRRATGRLTTGASAATPLVCRGSSCPFNERCVSGDTLVYTTKGMIRIKDIKKGSIIYSVNNDTYELERDIVTHVVSSGTKDVYSIKTAYGFEVILTEDHPILTLDKNIGDLIYTTLKDGLSVNSTILIVDADLEARVDTINWGDLYEDTIQDISYVGVKEVYDITVRKNHNFIGNNIVLHNCQWFKEDLHEVGEDCIIETDLINYWTVMYMNELDIDPTSISELHIVSRLVEIAIMDTRMSNYLALKNQDLMMDFIASVDPEGNEISNKGVSVAFDVKERLERQKMKLLESLNSTRDKKAKLELDQQKSIRSERKDALAVKLGSIAEALRESKSKNEPRIIDIN